MYLRSLSLILTLLLDCAISMSISKRQDVQGFRMQTIVVSGTDCGSNKQGLFIVSYHTGAALSIATGSSDFSVQPTTYFHLNDTQLLWTIPGQESKPWYVSLWANDQYNDFLTVGINLAGGPSTGFYLDQQVGVTNEMVKLWLMCDWGYDEPQLYAVKKGANAKIPTSCSQVTLSPVPVN